MWNRALALAHTLTLAALVTAASGAAHAQETGSKPAVVATVNGKSLTEAEFQRRCERQIGGVSDTAVGYVVLREWIEGVVAEEEAARKKLLPTTADVERRVSALRKQWEFRGEDFQNWLSTHGRTLDMLREELRRQLIAENLLTDGINASEAEVAAFYAGNRKVLGLPEQVRLSRITVDDKKTVRDVEAALKKGAAFEQLARQHSIDPYGKGGGSLPEPVEADPKGDSALEPGLLEKALKLAPGKVSDPIAVGKYWVFVRVDEKLPARAPALADVSDLLTANLRVQKAGPERLKTAQERLTQLQREAKVEIFRPEYQALLKRLAGKG